MNVCDYIKNYIKTHNIENYTLKYKYVTKNDIIKPLQLSGGVAFFYKIFAEGDIANISNLSKKFLQVSTPTDYWDFSAVAELVDFGTIQKLETDFIFFADNTVNFKLFENTDESIFNTIYNFCAQYVYMIPLASKENKSDNKQDNDIKVKVKF